MAQGQFKYAQLPVFKYQTFDRESLQFSDIPIIPPIADPPVVLDDDADEPLKEGDGPMDMPLEEVDIVDIQDLDTDVPKPTGTSIVLSRWYYGNTKASQIRPRLEFYLTRLIRRRLIKTC